jgi:hypothetical protein
MSLLLVATLITAMTEAERAFGRRQGAVTPIVDQPGHAPIVEEIRSTQAPGSTTVVTAYFLMESKYPSDKYVEWMKHFFKLETPMVRKTGSFGRISTDCLLTLHCCCRCR